MNHMCLSAQGVRSNVLSTSPLRRLPTCGFQHTKLGNSLRTTTTLLRLHLPSNLLYDGPHAGQSVPHVHIHILPRKDGDFVNNDEIYDAIDAKEKELKKKLDLDKERKDRSMEERAQEAAEYRKFSF
uniref:Putative histidine triad (HIT) protein n=1 Tax=Helianthus annuus TaxID=4232 RepID=A0A251U8S1_HELAN